MTGSALGSAFVVLVGFLVVGWSLTNLLYKDTLNLFEQTILAFALGSGTSTVVLFGSFLLFGKVSYYPSLLVLGGLVGLSLTYARPHPKQALSTLSQIPRDAIWQIAIIIGGVTTILVCLRASYWPFYAWDALSHWALRGITTYETGEIVARLPSKVSGQLHNKYPLWLPLAYDWAAFVNGQWSHSGFKLINAAVYPALLGSTYLLGRKANTRKTGLIAVIGVSFTPLLTMFAAIGYADLPLALFTTLATYFSVQALRSGASRDFFTAGMLTGLGGWTKIEGAFVGVLFLGVLISFTIYRVYPDLEQVAGSTMSAGIGFSLFVGPWYLYLLISGLLSGASSSFLSLPVINLARVIDVFLVLLQVPTALDPYDPLGILVPFGYVIIALGMGLIGWLLTQRRAPFLLSIAFINTLFIYYTFYQTYHDLWFLLTESAPRFLVHFIPIVVVLVIIAVQDILTKVILPSIDVPTQLQALTEKRALRFLLILVLLLGVIPISSGAELRADAYMFTHPDEPTDQKYRYRLGGTYQTITTLETQTESNATIYIIDNYSILAPYFLRERHVVPPFIRSPATVQTTIQNPRSAEQWYEAIGNAEIDYIAVAGPSFVSSDEDRERQVRYLQSASHTERIWKHRSTTNQSYIIYRVNNN